MSHSKKRWVRTVSVGAALLVALAGAGPVAAQAKPEKLTIGIVTFLSGGAAGPFGVPARNGAEILIENLNQGKVPAPYGEKGIGGVPVETVFVDENGGATRQVTELRNLVQRQNVDLVIGYISSGDCLAVAPVAEELKKLTVLFDCGTPRIFEERPYKYVFRTAGHAILDSVGAARYLLSRKPYLKTIAGINQNYAWGQDSWNDFKASVLALKPDVKEVTVRRRDLGVARRQPGRGALELLGR
jgi:branched-chain amino acid transport system substrate-binding protein